MLRASHAALAVVLALSAFAPPAHAVPITLYGTGQIDSAYAYTSPGREPLYRFTVGEAISLEVTYDLSPFNNPGYVPVWFFATTEGGGYVSITPGDIGGQGSVGIAGGILRGLNTVDGTGSVYMDFDGDAMHVNYGRDDNQGVGHGFTATLTRTDDPDIVTAPEPSTLAMGLVGAAMAGAGWMRRKAA